MVSKLSAYLQSVQSASFHSYTDVAACVLSDELYISWCHLYMHRPQLLRAMPGQSLLLWASCNPVLFLRLPSVRLFKSTQIGMCNDCKVYDPTGASQSGLLRLHMNHRGFVSFPDLICCHDEVAFILSVLIVQNNDHVTSSESLKSTLNAVKAIWWQVQSLWRGWQGPP